MRAIINNAFLAKKMKLRNHLYALFPLTIFTLIISIGVYFFYQKYGIPDNTMMTIMIILYSVFAVPAIFLHVEYIINDYDVKLTIDYKNQKLGYKKNKYEIIFTFDEIENVYFFGETKDFNNLTTQNYSFYLIKVKNNKPFIVTCLVVRNIESIIPKINIIKYRRLFPSILFEKMT